MVDLGGTRRGTANGYSLFDFKDLNDDVGSTRIADKKLPAASMATLTWKNGILSFQGPLHSRGKSGAFDMRGRSLGSFAEGYSGPTP